MNFSEIGTRENAPRHMCVCSPDEPCRTRHKTRNLQQAIYHVEVRFEEFEDFAQRRNHPSGTATRMICYGFCHVLSKIMFFYMLQRMKEILKEYVKMRRHTLRTYIEIFTIR